VADLDELAVRLLAFQEHYNATAEPFDWTFTTAKPNAFLDRIAAHLERLGTAAQPPTNFQSAALVSRNS
jgi:hypothetical protein